MKKLKCTLCSEEVDTKSTSLIEHYAKHNITVQNNSAFKDFLATFISSNCCSKEEVYIVCFVCGKELNTKLEYKKHLFEIHPYLGFSKEEFDDKINQGLVDYHEKEIVSRTGRSGSRSYTASAGEFSHPKIGWKSQSAGNLFIAVAKKCIDW